MAGSVGTPYSSVLSPPAPSSLSPTPQPPQPQPQSQSQAPPLQPQLRTCTLCRQRRIKCDRQMPRCSNCQWAEATCVYPPGRGRAPKRPRRGVPPQLSERLARLESIISQASAAQGGVNSQENPHTREAADGEDSFEQEDFSRLKVDESKSYYVSNPLWVTLSSEVEELRDLLFEPANEDSADYEQAPSPFASEASFNTTATMPSSSRPGLSASILGYRAVAASLQHLHPTLPQAVALYASFTDNVSPLVRIFHMPMLTRTYWDAIASVDTLDKITETLLFCIHYSAVVSLNSAACLKILGETRESALERFRFAVEQALARGDLLNTQNMTMLQAAVLFLSALPNEEDSRAAWSLTSLIYHIARTIGLHRDGTKFGLKPFETEMRRRLWWQICIIDSRSSEYHCNEPIARAFTSDTKPPLHIDDVDLFPDMVEPPAERWDRATDMTLSRVRCEAIQTGMKLGLVKQRQTQKPSGSGASTADDGQQPRNEADVLIQNLETCIRDKYLPICDTSVPFQLLCSAVARIIMARFHLITRFSAASREKGPTSDSGANKQSIPFPETTSSAVAPSQAHDELFQTSIEILQVSGVLLSNDAIAQFTWYSKTHIQWGAMAFVLSELCTRPHSAECDHAWACVETVYDGWRVGAAPDDEGRLALWRPIRRLMAKARYVREMQRMDIRRPALAGVSARDHRPSRPIVTESLVYESLPPHADNSAGHGVPPRTAGSVLSSESPRPELPANTFEQEPLEALQRVIGTEKLGPFMDMDPDWPWHDEGLDNPPWLAGANFDQPPGLW
ncbi:transcription factor [Xylaria intraflava]|nr:transcription factor [Xylaria intraflava]